MDHDVLEKGLKDRGFVGIDEFCSMGKCHKDEKHYILITDGLVIYSNIPFHTDIEYHKDSLKEEWCIEADEYCEGYCREFNFEELDEILII